MTWAVLSGALIASGVVLLVSGWIARPSLADRLAAVDAVAGTTVGVDTAMAPGRWELVETRLAGRLGRVSRFFLDDKLSADLNLLGIPASSHAAHQVVGALIGLAITPLIGAAAATAVGLPWLAGAAIAFVGAGVGGTVPVHRVRVRARQMRRTFLSTVVVYLDLVAMRMASGSGATEALRDAAGIGDGYGWRRLRAALQDARAAGHPPSAGLAKLGSATGLPELVELAAHLDLGDTTGAQSQASLRAKADALRDRMLADLHGDASARTSTLMVAHMLMAIGYLILVGYPALAAVLTL